MNARALARAATVAALAASTSTGRAGDVTTFHFDLQRSGWNSHEPALTPGALTAGFGKLWYAPLDGQAYAAPLYLTGVPIGGATRSVAYAATENNSVYALDAATGELLWRTPLGPSVPQGTFDQTLLGEGGCSNVNPIHGITSTPVIDRAANTLYACALTMLDGRQAYELFAVDVATGRPRPGWPVRLEGAAGSVTFHAEQQTQRGALALVNGRIYVPFSSRCDIGEWHGWLAAVDAGDPAASVRWFNAVPVGAGGGIWGSGGVSADAEGRIYAVTGNGPFDLASGGADAGDSVVRLTPSTAGLAFSGSPGDYFTPANYAELQVKDLDLGGSSAVLLPDQPLSGTPHLMATGAKDGTVYLLNRDRLGGVGGDLDRYGFPGIGLPTSIAVILTTPACWTDAAGETFFYVTALPSLSAMSGVAAFRLTLDPGSRESRMAFAWTNPGRLKTPGAPVVSSDGGRSGVVWVIDARKTDMDQDRGDPGALLAYDAKTGAALWDSDRSPWDALGEARKFSAPTVIDGRVFVAGGYAGTTGVAAYGPLSAPGDVNGDGATDVRDAVLALRAAVDLETLSAGQDRAADVNADGRVDVRDVVLLLRRAVGLP